MDTELAETKNRPDSRPLADEEEKGERGIPYTVREARIVANTHKMDPHHRELMRFLVRKIEKAAKTANNVIRLDDSSDCWSALWEVCRTLGIPEDEIGEKFLEEDEIGEKPGI